MALTDNLVAFWELEEASGSRADATGRGNTLGDNNTVTSGAGRAGIATAAQFTAANSEYLSSNDAADLSMGDIDFTIAAWVYMDTVGVDRTILAKRDGVNGDYVLDYLTAFTCFQFRAWNAAGFTGGVSAYSGSVSATNWYYVVAWYNAAADTINIQVNNGTPLSDALTGGAYDSTALFYMGRNSTGQYWDGRIDQVGIWKRVLTTQERTDLYNSGNGLSYAAMGAGNPAPGVGALTLAGTGTVIAKAILMPSEP